MRNLVVIHLRDCADGASPSGSNVLTCVLQAEAGLKKPQCGLSRASDGGRGYFKAGPRTDFGGCGV